MRAGLEQAVPFNQHIGLRVADLATGRCVVHLSDDGHLRNHTGSQHASALFAAGEAACGGALITAFVEHLEKVGPMPEGAEIHYRKLARGPIVATAELEADPARLLDELERAGEVRFAIAVALTDRSGDVVADMTVRWAARRDDA